MDIQNNGTCYIGNVLDAEEEYTLNDVIYILERGDGAIYDDNLGGDDQAYIDTRYSITLQTTSYYNADRTVDPDATYNNAIIAKLRDAVNIYDIYWFLSDSQKIVKLLRPHHLLQQSLLEDAADTIKASTPLLGLPEPHGVDETQEEQICANKMIEHIHDSCSTAEKGDWISIGAEKSAWIDLFSTLSSYITLNNIVSVGVTGVMLYIAPGKAVLSIMTSTALRTVGSTIENYSSEISEYTGIDEQYWQFTAQTISGFKSQPIGIFSAMSLGEAISSDNIGSALTALGSKHGTALHNNLVKSIVKVISSMATPFIVNSYRQTGSILQDAYHDLNSIIKPVDLAIDTESNINPEANSINLSQDEDSNLWDGSTQFGAKCLIKETGKIMSNTYYGSKPGIATYIVSGVASQYIVGIGDKSINAQELHILDFSVFQKGLLSTVSKEVSERAYSTVLDNNTYAVALLAAFTAHTIKHGYKEMTKTSTEHTVEVMPSNNTYL